MPPEGRLRGGLPEAPQRTRHRRWLPPACPLPEPYSRSSAGGGVPRSALPVSLRPCETPGEGDRGHPALYTVESVLHLRRVVLGVPSAPPCRRLLEALQEHVCLPHDPRETGGGGDLGGSLCSQMGLGVERPVWLRAQPEPSIPGFQPRLWLCFCCVFSGNSALGGLTSGCCVDPVRCCVRPRPTQACRARARRRTVTVL